MRFSVVTTVFDPVVEHLAECLASVDRQSPGRDGRRVEFEHVVVDDASTDAGVLRLLTEPAAHRTVTLRPSNGGIVAAGNDALAAARGEFVVFLDHDDVLAPDALGALDAAIRGASVPERVGVVYSDHDLIRADGRLVSPVYKPDFSPERLRNHNYVTHLVAMRRSLVERVGGFAVGTDGAQDHDLLLRVTELDDVEVLHVPAVLAHWRQSPASVSADVRNKPGAFAAGVRVVQTHCDRIGMAASVGPGDHPGVYRIRRSLSGRPTVSVVVPTAGASGRVWGRDRTFVVDAVGSLRPTTDVDLEIVLVVDDRTPADVAAAVEAVAPGPVVVVVDPRPFHFSERVDAGVQRSSGEFVLLLNDDTELVAAGSIGEMVGLAQQLDVGMVGAKLLFDDGTLQHAGHVYNASIDHAFTGWDGTHPGPHRLLCVEREVAGVTAAAALLRRSVYDEVGGMSSAFPRNYNDVDLSMRIRADGRRIVWTPHAVWFHFEQRTFAHPVTADEIAALAERWGGPPWHDPYSNPNLHQDRADWLELPGRSGAPPFEIDEYGRVSWA
jgi:GT2 family glycosyltransferase